MNVYEKRGASGVIAIIIFVVLVTVIVMANRWLEKETGKIVSKSVDAPVVSQKAPTEQKKPKIKRTGEVIRKTRFSPDRKYKINVFYQEGVEVARNRSAKGEAYDQKGEIPDGKVKFINESNETYGVEYYRNGKRNGPAKTYYKDGALREDTYYQFGKLMTNTEYFHDGIVRMEKDYTNARDSRSEKEVGIGKVYSRDGALKYEWFMTVTEPIGYKKSYNSRGDLVAEFYFDEYGQPMEKEEEPPGVAVATGSTVAPVPGVPAASAVVLDPSIPPPAEKPPKQIFISTE